VLGSRHDSALCANDVEANATVVVILVIKKKKIACTSAKLIAVVDTCKIPPDFVSMSPNVDIPLTFPSAPGNYDEDIMKTFNGECRWTFAWKFEITLASLGRVIERRALES